MKKVANGFFERDCSLAKQLLETERRDLKLVNTLCIITREESMLFIQQIIYFWVKKTTGHSQHKSNYETVS